MQKIFLSLITVFILTTILFAGTIFGPYGHSTDNNQVTITWTTISEADVARFVIVRSLDNNVFKEAGTVQAKGEASDYTFIDDNVYFKTTQTFFYRIRALKNNGEVLEETGQSILANPQISGIIRTWGAIKDMFR